MTWLLIVTVLFSDGDRYTGPLSAETYSEKGCASAKASIYETTDHRFVVVAASCISSTPI